VVFHDDVREFERRRKRPRADGQQDDHLTALAASSGFREKLHGEPSPYRYTVPALSSSDDV
jgi:hypothetical protein